MAKSLLEESAVSIPKPEAVFRNDKPATQAATATSLPLLIAAICVAVFLLSIDRTIVAIATPYITDQFHSYSDVGWYGSAYLITVCALQPAFGRMYTSFDVKWTYIAAFGVFEVGSLVCGVAPSSRALIVGRAVAGCGAAGVLSGSYVIVGQVVPAQKRPITIAGVSMLFSLGAILAPLIGGGFTENVTWRWCFYINLPVGLPVMAAMVFLFSPPKASCSPEKSESTPSVLERIWSIDIPGAILLLGAAIMLFLSLQFASDDHAWSSALVAGLTTGAGVTFLVLLAWTALQGERALIPPRILGRRTVLASAAAAVALYGALTTQVYYLPIYFQATRTRSPIGSAVDLLPLIVATSIFSIIAGVLVTAIGLSAPFAILGAALAVAGTGLLTTLDGATSTARWAGFQILAGTGYGLAIQQGFFAVQAVLPPSDIPVGTSLITFCQSLGGALAVSIGEDILLESLRGSRASLSAAGIDIDRVIAAGATGFRSLLDSSNALNALLPVYNEALRRVFILAAVFAGISLLASCFMEMKHVHARSKASEQDEGQNTTRPVHSSSLTR